MRDQVVASNSEVNTSARERVASASGLIRRVYSRFTGINGHIYAAAISYFVLISLFPWLIFLVTLLTLTVRDPVIQSQVIEQIINQFPTGSRIQSELRAFVAEITVRRSGLLGFVGLITTIVVASEAFRALRYALNTIFGLTQNRSFLRGRAIDLLGMIAVLIFGLLSAALAGFLTVDWITSSNRLAFLPAVPFVVAVQFILSFLLSFFAFSLMYRVVPEVDLGWRVVWIPGLIAATGFELARFGMGLFLAYFGRFQQLYGALSLAVVVLVFVFIVANIVLLAGALAVETGGNDRPRQPRGGR